jgi:hypothetical protein
MSCTNAGCHCQSEVFISRHGSDYCSEHCAGATPGADTPCACGHVGCSAADEQSLAEGPPA